ncbi:MAG: response regulator [Myxococcales bacterium]|nr:MAG: response regulator [Myxococcales bacterium]
MNAMQHLLVVEDDEVFRERLVDVFIERGYQVSAAASIKEANAKITKQVFSHAVLDLRLNDGNGMSLIKPLRVRFPSIKTVVLTGYGSIATAVAAVRDGATHYLSKPADADDIERAFHTEAVDANETPKEVPSLARVEWEHIQRVLSDCGGNISLAARKLGIHRRSLQRKLSKYPMPR